MYNKLQKLKQEKDAVILAHYYAPDEVQKAADFIGDSFFLAKAAKSATQKTIVFCGVNFMGESAKLLNPDKTVLMPDITADCPMAHMVTEEKIKKVKEENEDTAVVCYINSTAKIKSLSDVCVTSANALNIVRKLPNKNIFFIPDGNLGRYIKEQVPEKNVILNDGYCPIHHTLTADILNKQKSEHPNALVLVHPECQKEIIETADYVGSTSGIIEFAKKSDNDEFIICTEPGVGYELNKIGKKFYFLGDDFICADMKLNTLEKLCDCLENGTGEIFIDDELREKALCPLDKMLELA